MRRESAGRRRQSDVRECRRRSRRNSLKNHLIPIGDERDLDSSFRQPRCPRESLIFRDRYSRERLGLLASGSQGDRLATARACALRSNAMRSGYPYGRSDEWRASARRRIGRFNLEQGIAPNLDSSARGPKLPTLARRGATFAGESRDFNSVRPATRKPSIRSIRNARRAVHRQISSLRRASARRVFLPWS